MNNPFNFIPNFMNFQNMNQPMINPNQFRSFLPKINDQMLAQMVEQARKQGISEEDIEKGLKFIKSL